MALEAAVRAVRDRLGHRVGRVSDRVDKLKKAYEDWTDLQQIPGGGVLLCPTLR